MDKRNLISEDLKRYRQLLEYTFYVPEEKEKDEDLNGDLLLDDMYLTEQDPTGGEETEAGTDDPFAAAAEIPDAESTPAETGDETTDPEETDVEVEDEFADEPADTADMTATPELPTDMGGETVEVDVTDIVDKTEQTKTTVDNVSSKMDELMSKLSELETQISGMDNVINKIDELEKEIEKRNPTPVERLEMRSMDSFPYSVKLTDFWADKEGYQTKEEEEEYTLRQSDVDNFDEREIKSSFDYNTEKK